VSGVDQGIGVLDGGGYRRRGRGSFGVNLGRPIVISYGRANFFCFFGGGSDSAMSGKACTLTF